MSEIRVPVTVPGANKAAMELRGVASAANAVGKAEEAAAKSTDKLTEAQKRAQAAAKATAAKWQALGRAGGVGGGLLGRIGGGMGSAQLGSLGPLAAGAAVAAFALTKLADISNHAVERATALAKALIDTRNAVESGRTQGGKNRLADFHENGQVLRRLITGGTGVDGTLGKHADGPEAAAHLAGFSDAERAETAKYAAVALKSLGVTGSLMEGLGKLGEDRIASAMGGEGDPINRLIGEILGEQRGSGPASVDEVRAMRARAYSDPAIGQLDATGAAEGGARLARLGGAADPAAAAAVMADRAAWLDPVNTALMEIAKQQSQALEQMQAAADAELGVMGLLKDIFTPGGSFETQLRRAMNDRAAVVLGSSN